MYINIILVFYLILFPGEESVTAEHPTESSGSSTIGMIFVSVSSLLVLFVILSDIPTVYLSVQKALQRLNGTPRYRRISNKHKRVKKKRKKKKQRGWLTNKDQVIKS